MSDLSTLCNYYTPEGLAVKLIDLIPKKCIKTAFDLNCGDGALLKAARKRFPHVALVGVDIKMQNFHKSLSKCTFICENSIDYMNKCDCTYDLLLANPPFQKIDNVENIKWCIAELERKRMECVMLNANLSLMHEKSWLIIILPSTFVMGTTYKKIRKAISSTYGIYGMVLLPEDTFGTCLIKTYALILCSKKERIKTTSCWEALNKGNDWTLERKTDLTQSEVKNGFWWKQTNNTINHDDFILFRGTVKSSDFIKGNAFIDGTPVYHTAVKNKSTWKPKVKYTHVLQEAQADRVACKGDIIINRIGKAAGYWWINTKEELPVSDCLFVLKKFSKCVCRLKQVSEKGRLKLPLRGVATQYITKEDILGLLS